VVSVDRGLVVWIDPDGTVESVAVGGGPNGATLDGDGAVLIAQAGSSSPISSGPPSPGGIQLVDRSGELSWVSQAPESPNDLCVGPDGLVYCTDPTRPLKLSRGHVWRCDRHSGEAELLASMDWYPNGIGFGLDDDQLYVADTTNRRIVRYQLGGDRAAEPELAVAIVRGHPDGFAFDADGNLVVAAVAFDDGERGEIQTYSPEGELLDVLHPGAGALYTNVAIGPTGEMVITASSEGRVLRGRHSRPGLALYPFR
jgi:gluconolactonase